VSKKIDIIIQALPRWDGAYSSTPYSLAVEFSKTHRVFYIDNPFTLKDVIYGLSKKPIKKRIIALLFGKNSTKKIHSNFYAVTPQLTLPINFLPPSEIYNKFSALNDRIYFRTIRKILKKYNINNFIFINSFNPFFARNFPHFFQPKLYIYQSIDDINQSLYINKHGKRLEPEAIKKADLTITTSRQLHQSISRTSKLDIYIPNGVNLKLFSEKYYSEQERPCELLNIINKKIIIYIGNIDYRIDYKLIVEVLNFHKEKLFVFIGPVNIKKNLLNQLNLSPNICFIGKKNLEELPKYIFFSDCTIIPFNCNELTNSIYPLKANEYLASGKPIVSTVFSEDIRDLGHVIYLSLNNLEFCKNIDLALKENSTKRIQERIKEASQNSWSKRADYFWEVVNPFLRENRNPK